MEDTSHEMINAVSQNGTLTHLDLYGNVYCVIYLTSIKNISDCKIGTQLWGNLATTLKSNTSTLIYLNIAIGGKYIILCNYCSRLFMFWKILERLK